MSIRAVNVDDYLLDDSDTELELPTTNNNSTRKTRIASSTTSLFEEDTVTPEIEDVNEVPQRASIVQAGWKAAQKVLKDRAESTSYVKNFKFTESPQLVKFLTDGPVATYRQHWITREGKQSFVCIGEKCPLCNVLGDVPSNKVVFSILNLSADPVEAQLITVGPRFGRTLEAKHNDPRQGPLNATDKYWDLSKTGTGKSTIHQISMVRSRDLNEDWGLDPAEVEEAVDAAVAHSPEDIQVNTYEELLEVARSV